MASTFDAHPDPDRRALIHQTDLDPSMTGSSANSPVNPMNSLKRDRFELLSAYLDGEVTAEERRQVESWLRNDASMQQLYTRLLKLRQGFQSLSVPPVESVERTVNQVIDRVDRRPRQYLRWGGVAIAATVLVMVSDLIATRSPTGNSLQVAEAPITELAPAETVESNALMIALDQPIIEIPKATVSQPIPSGQTLLYDSSSDIR